MLSRKQKITNFLRHHRLAIWLVIAAVLYFAFNYLKWELAGHGTELLVYPTIEVLLEKFINEP